MFTLEDIGVEIRKVKSFAEFPSLLDNLRNLGVVKYDNLNTDGKSIYYGKDNFQLAGIAKFKPVEISDTVDAEALKTAILSHKNEETNFQRFSKQMADAGAKVWTVDTNTKEITYYGNNGFEILTTKV